MLQYFQIHEGKEPLGMHFHREVTEEFHILSGEGILLTSRVNTEGKPIDSENCILPITSAVVSKHKLVAGDMVTCSPFTAHAFYLKLGSEMVCFVSLSDPDDVVSVPWLVLAEGN